MSASHPKRIALVIRWPTGGIRTFVKYTYLGMGAARYQPVIVAPAGLELDYLVDNLEPLNPIVRRIAGGGPAGFVAAVTRAVISDRAMLVHSHGFTSAATSALPSALLRVPHVISVHDIVTEGLAAKLGKVRMKVLGAVLGSARVVHSVSHDQARNLEHHFELNARRRTTVRVISPGVDVQLFSNASPRPLRSELELARETFVIGFLGRFMAPKGFGLLIDAVEALSCRTLPRPLAVVAVGAGGFIREDRAEIERRGLARYFHFLPLVETAAATIAGLDCLAMPSRSEAFGLLAAEALCIGVPVIASDCIGLREVTAGSPARVFPTGDAVRLADALEAELRAPTTALAHEYRATAHRRFDVRQSAQRLLELYEGILA